MKAIKVIGRDSGKVYVVNLDRITYINVTEGDINFDGDDEWVCVDVESMKRVLEALGFEVVKSNLMLNNDKTVGVI